jgi:hypothetical protein
MRSPEFEAMIGPAKLFRDFWRILLGALLILYVYIGTVLILALALFAATGPLEFMPALMRLTLLTDPVSVLLMLATFLGMFLGPIIAAAACHYRGPGTLFGPREETLRGFFIAVLAAVPLYAAVTSLGFRLDPPVENLAWPAWLGYLPFFLPLLLLQVTAEELVFRSYLPQQLAARFRSRWVWMVLPAAIFSALHFNPQMGRLLPLIFLSAFVFGLIASDLTERTGSLGAAIGLHFVNNFVGMGLVALSGAMSGLAKWVTPYTISDPEAQNTLAIALGANVIFLLVVWRVVRWALER